MRFSILIPIALLLYSCQPKVQKEFFGVPFHDIEEAATNHLDDWFPMIVDNDNGGYFTNFEKDWKRSDNQTKMLVTQARGLWTASKAAQLTEEHEKYEVAALHGYKFLTQKMWDNEKGGFYLYANLDNSVDTTSYKLLYANAFALFALSEYAKISPSNEVFMWINKTFDWIDSVAHDDNERGYFNLILNDELKADTPENKKKISQINWGDPEWKDQNTSIHLLEAFTTCYQVMPVPKIEKRLKEMLVLVRDTMTQPNASLKLNFMKNWNPIDHTDSSRAYILEQQNFDHISFGHNIETAYLIIDASKTLYGKVDSTSLAIAKKLSDHTLKYGFAANFYGLYDRGYQFKVDGKIEIIDSRKAWWSQFEAWHTLALMANYFPNEDIYKTAFAKQWNYIQTELYDSVNGGYYNLGLDESPKAKENLKAYNWKGPYHDGRALMMVWQYALNAQ